MSGYVLAIDQGTTSSRAIIFDQNFRVKGIGQQEIPQIFPHSAWVEHDPMAIWESVVATIRFALSEAGLNARDIATIGITNQRETVVIWDRTTGKPIYNAIVWQDRRTSELCDQLTATQHEKMVREKTGLIIDPYFSATKIAWILDHVEGARQKAERGALAFGTIDSFLLWQLTRGKVHATDATNASRTLLYNIEQNCWDEDLLKLFNIPAALLPQIYDCDAHFGETDKNILGGTISICGIVGDQQAATVGQACFEPGMVKSTYGTGCFAVLNTGNKRVHSQNRLLTTVGYRLNGKTTFALEGSIFIAGATIQWLRDGLKIISRADESDQLAKQADEEQEVYFVPAFTGLGAPWWDAQARGALYGLTRNTGIAEIAKASLEAVVYQTHDLISAMHNDWPQSNAIILRVDGGMAASDWTMQRLADILNAPVDRPVIMETTALGAAWVAGQKAGIWPDMQGFAQKWQLDRRFTVQMSDIERQHKLKGWQDAVSRTLSK